jgi:hypothetical protein
VDIFGQLAIDTALKALAAELIDRVIPLYGSLLDAATDVWIEQRTTNDPEEVDYVNPHFPFDLDGD